MVTSTDPTTLVLQYEKDELHINPKRTCKSLSKVEIEDSTNVEYYAICPPQKDKENKGNYFLIYM
jgi:hypothetical protein